MESTRTRPVTRHITPERIALWTRHVVCAVSTLAVLAAVSPPLLHAQDLLALASPASRDAAGAGTVRLPETSTEFRRIDLHATPAAPSQGPLTLRDFHAGYALTPFTLGLAEIGPDPVDCSLVTTAPAAGRTAGGRACAQPVRVKLAWW